MKPRPRPSEPYSWTYSFIVPLHIYLDDLRDCFRLLEQIGAVRAESDTHVDIGSFEDLLQQQGRPMKDLTIVATSPDEETVTAQFGQSGASITITSPQAEFVGVLHQIQQVAWRHWRKNSLADTGVTFALGAGLLSLVVATSAGSGFPFPWGVAFAVALALIGGLVLTVYLRERRTHWTLMPMIWYADRPPSFIARNKDQIVINAAIALVFFALGIWAQIVITSNPGNVAP